MTLQQQKANVEQRVIKKYEAHFWRRVIICPNIINVQIKKLKLKEVDRLLYKLMIIESEDPYMVELL